MRALRLAIVALLLAFQAVTAHADRFHVVKHQLPVVVPPVGTPNVYDARYGTATAQSAIDGWFTFGLHAGNRQVWLNGATGSDSNSCLTAVLACATFDHAYGVFENGSWTSGDQFMIAGGSTYTTSTSWNGGAGGFCTKPGISAAYPTAVLSYDPADPTNTAKYGKLLGSARPTIHSTGDAFSNACGGGESNYAVQGFIFDSQDADGPTFASFTASTHNNIIFQNCEFLGYQITISGAGGGYDATGASYAQGGNFSKNAVVGGWASGGNMQGLYMFSRKDFTIEDNTWAHVGWRVGSARTDSGPNGGANGVNHPHYIGATNMGIVLRRNFYVDPSYESMDVRSSATIVSAASLDAPLAAYFGAYSGSFQENPDGITITLDDGLFVGGSPLTNSGPADGPHNADTLSGSHIRNVAAFDNPLPGTFIGSDTGIYAFDIVSLTHSGTTATLVTSISHAMVTGNLIIVDGASPSAYNVVRVPVTVIDAHTVTYTMATTPATDATVLGKYMPTVPQFMLIDKVHSYNYTTAWESLNWITDQIFNTYTNIVSDQLASGTGNSTSSAGTFPSYKTRDQVVTAVLNGVGVTPLGSYYARKAQVVDWAIGRADLPWAQWFIGVGLPAMNLTPTYNTPAFQTITGSAPAIYPTSLSNLTISSTTFTHGVSKTVLLSGVSANPVLTVPGGLPSGCSISGRAITCNAVSAGTPSVTVHETTQDGGMSHDTTFTFTISFLAFGLRRRKAANDNTLLEMAA